MKVSFFNNCYLKPIVNEKESKEFHAIRRMEIFEARGLFNFYTPFYRCRPELESRFYILTKNLIVIGTLQLDIINSTEVALRTVAIKGKYKNKGYGTYMIKVIEVIVASQGYKIIRLHSNPEAVKFYKKLGFVEEDFLYEKSIFSHDIDMSKHLVI